MVKVFNTTFNNISVISWMSVLLVEVTGVPGENHQPIAGNWQTLSHNVVSSTLPWTGFELTISVAIDTDYTGSCKFNYHTITMTTAHVLCWWFVVNCKLNLISPGKPLSPLENIHLPFQKIILWKLIQREIFWSQRHSLY